MREEFRQEDGHSSDLDQKRSGYSIHDSKPQGEWDRVAELMMTKFGQSGHPVFRATSPLSRGTPKSTGGGKLSIHFLWIRLKLFFAQSLLLISSVSDLREEYKACHVRTGRLVMAGQSDPLFVPTSSLMKTPTPSIEFPAQEY